MAATATALGLLTASVSVTLVADLLYNGLAAHGLVETMPGWLQAAYTVGVLLMTAAAFSSDSPSADRPDLRTHDGRPRSPAVGWSASRSGRSACRHCWP